MFQHVIDSSIDATAATELLETAEKAKRMDALKDDFDAWVAAKKHELREKEKLRKLQGGKELSAAEKQVKRLLPRHLLDHWLELIQEGKGFDEEAEWDFAAHLDSQSRRLHVGSVNLDLDKAPPEQIAKVASKLSLLSKQLGPIVKERLTSGRAEANDDVLYDLEYLTQFGAQDLADHLKERFEKAKEEKDEPLAGPVDAVGEEVVSQDSPPAADNQEVAILNNAIQPQGRVPGEMEETK